MSDKTVPANAEDYKDDNPDDNVDTSHEDGDTLVKEAESERGEIPNRDEDEFTKRHLKAPEIDIDTENAINKQKDEI